MNCAKRTIAVAVAVAATIAFLPLVPLLMLTGAVTQRGEERGHFEW